MSGALISDALGREIDRNDDGHLGGAYIVTVSGTRATPGGLPLARIREQRAAVPAAIDALLARGELAGSGRGLHARREGHRLKS